MDAGFDARESQPTLPAVGVTQAHRSEALGRLFDQIEATMEPSPGAGDVELAKKLAVASALACTEEILNSHKAHAGFPNDSALAVGRVFLASFSVTAPTMDHNSVGERVVKILKAASVDELR